MWDLSSPTRGWTCVPCIGKLTLNDQGSTLWELSCWFLFGSGGPWVSNLELYSVAVALCYLEGSLGPSWSWAFPSLLGGIREKKKKQLSISSKQKQGVYLEFLVPIPSGCLPSHWLYFPLLEGDNLINSSVLKGLQVTMNAWSRQGGWAHPNCMTEGGRPLVSQKKIWSYQERGWQMRSLWKTHIHSDLFHYGNSPLPTFSFPFLFLVPVWAGFSVTAPEKHHYCHEGSSWSSWVGRQGLWFSWVTDELYVLGECHFTSVVLAFVL